MRITIITGPLYPLPPSGFGAVEKIWYDFARYFANKGHTVNMLACRKTGEPKLEMVKGVAIYRATNFASTRFLLINVIYDLIYSLWMLFKLPKSDITVINSFWMPVLACLRKKRIGKIVYNLARYPKGQMAIYARVDRIATVSNAVYKAAVAQSEAVSSNIKVIPNPINTELFCVKGNIEINENAPVIVYSGRIHPEKGIDLLIKSFRKVYGINSSVKLRLIGTWDIDKSGGGEKYLEKLKVLAQGLPVEFVGAVTDPEGLAKQLRQCDIYVYPSLADHGESFGVAPLEAMGVGLPVIVSNLDCFKDFVEDGANGLIFNHKDEDAVDNLAECIEKLVTDNKFARTIATAASETAKDFSIDKVAEKYLSDFQELCNK